VVWQGRFSWLHRIYIFFLGIIFKTGGHCLEQDFGKAFSWFEKAVEKDKDGSLF